MISKDEIYLFVLNNIKSLEKKKEIFYLYGSLKYFNFSDFFQDEKEVLKIPINNIANIIQTYNTKLDKNLFFENISFLNDYYNYSDFNIKRDKILRKLYFNKKNNSINKLRLLCC